MRLTNVEIQNFRGIRNGLIKFPKDTGFICLIGAGDSTKSTILLAIEWIFSKTWNLSVCDNDFYNGNTENEIILRGTFTEFPDSFLSEDKFGQYLRKPNIPYDGTSNDEPVENQPLCLTIQFTVGNTLEPHWEVVCNRLDPKAISNKDRSKLAVGSIGENCAKDLSWGRFSVLQKYADAKGVLHDAYMSALRNAADNVDLKQLDDLAVDVIDIGNTYGVGFYSEVKNKLLIQNSSFSTSAGLYDGNVPLSLRGLGSQRLLSMGLNVAAYDNGVVLLVDEIEHGLEPYRLRSLVNQLREQSMSGQVIITTHSPVVITECDVTEITVVQSNDGQTTVFPFAVDDKKIKNQLQTQVRSDADAFLSKALIVCEGKTEIGFIKALDDYLFRSQRWRMAYKGVGTALGGGENIFKYADTFKEHGYFVSIFMDSDKESENEDKAARKKEGISIFDWSTPYSIEEQLFHDAPVSVIQSFVDIAVNEKGHDVISQALAKKDVPFRSENGSVIITDYSVEVRSSLGQLAKKNSKAKGESGGWFKRIDLGREIGSVVFDHIEEFCTESMTYKTIALIIDWIKNI